MLPLTSFLEELSYIVKSAIPLSFAPTQARLRGAAPLPAPAPLPKIDAVQVGNNFAMHRPTVLAHLERPAPASTAAKTIPAPAASLPRAGGILGAAERATIHAPSSFPASVAKTIAAPVSRLASRL